MLPAVFLVGAMVSPVLAGPPTDREDALGLALALRKLPTTTSLLQITAHPDDEDNALAVLVSHGLGARVGLLSLTRGDGGQNEIGSELFEALGIIRSEELMSAHRLDGAEQFFTRAYEFGYSFSVAETLEKWGKEEILGDIVQILRQFRPEVVTILPRGGRGGGQHHQTSARLAAEAFRAAADPGRFPAQLETGLQPWQASKLYERVRPASGSSADFLTVETGIFDPLLGKTYAQIGARSRSFHRSQGMRQLSLLPGRRSSYLRLIDSTIRPKEHETHLFDGLDSTLFAIENRIRGQSEKAPFLHPSLERIVNHIRNANRAFSLSDPSRPMAPLAAGLKELRHLQQQLAGSPLSADAKYQLSFTLAKKEADFVEALRLSHPLSLEALTEQPTVVPGAAFDLRVSVANAGKQDVLLEEVALELPDGWQAEATGGGAEEIAGESVVHRNLRIRVAEDAAPTRPYWFRSGGRVDRYQLSDPSLLGSPWAPPAVRVRARLKSADTRFELERGAEYRYTGPWVGGEQRHDVMVVPTLSLTTRPEVAILPLSQLSAGRNIRVSVLYQGSGADEAEVELQVPTGWLVTPRLHHYPFSRTGQSLTRIFRVNPSSGTTEGEFKLAAVGRLGEKTYREGYEIIDYDHIRRRHYYRPADVQVKIVDVRVPENVKVGYIQGVGDRLPEALQQLGVDWQFLTEDDLAFADLGAYRTIVTGIRAYLVRQDLRTYNSRLLDWVSRGGTLIVQYNKFEFNGDGGGPSPYAPYPLRIGRGRVTDENAPVRLLAPAHPVFRGPNLIDENDWAGWVQERGLYFVAEKSPEYRDLISTADPFEFNSGQKLGAWVEARHGKGRWIYLGIGLWRQLPAGVPGAYRLLANLIALGEPSNEADRRQSPAWK